MSKIHSRDVFADTQIERFINRNLAKDTYVDVAEYNQRAIDFYTKLGFVDTGRRHQEERFRMKSGAIITEMEMVRKAI